MTAKTNWIKGVPTSFPCWVRFNSVLAPKTGCVFRVEDWTEFNKLNINDDATHWLPAEPRPESPMKELTQADKDYAMWKSWFESEGMNGTKTERAMKHALAWDRAEVAKIANGALANDASYIGIRAAYWYATKALEQIAARSQ